MGWLGWLFVGQSAAGMTFYLAALRHTTVASVEIVAQGEMQQQNRQNGYAAKDVDPSASRV